MTLYGIEFKYPFMFLLLILVPVLVYFEMKRKNKGTKFAPINLLVKVYGLSSIWFYIEMFLSILMLCCFIIILANPGFTNYRNEESRKGIDIAIVMDISKSMLAEDILPNRLEASKKVIENFIKKLKDDRISFTIFAGKPFMSIPLTFDYNGVVKYIQSVTTESITQDIPGLSGTAIGDGLIVATDGLNGNKSEEKREKIIVLITDGDANVGINPKTALKYVGENKIKVYSIGIGNPEGTELFMTDIFGNKQYFIDANGTPIKAKLNEEMLKYLSSNSGGKYYNAQSKDSLNQIFDDLSRLNKTEIKNKIIKAFYPIYYYFVLIILLSLILFLGIKNKYKL
ncbi:MAG: VWA domain-containing protein [Candidatus Gracilibacteria bacterium]|nr:VWA domain-containing protein [Candidatus Gracilibacteria bacterium]MDD2908288.1 VWA domain-containing protein [Candidatus Gracilibacteria bacterium]